VVMVFIFLNLHDFFLYIFWFKNKKAVVVAIF
jgi:hypothetical protein